MRLVMPINQNLHKWIIFIIKHAAKKFPDITNITFLCDDILDNSVSSYSSSVQDLFTNELASLTNHQDEPVAISFINISTLPNISKESHHQYRLKLSLFLCHHVINDEEFICMHPIFLLKNFQEQIHHVLNTAGMQNRQEAISYTNSTRRFTSHALDIFTFPENFTFQKFLTVERRILVAIEEFFQNKFGHSIVEELENFTIVKPTENTTSQYFGTMPLSFYEFYLYFKIDKLDEFVPIAPDLALYYIDPDEPENVVFFYENSTFDIGYVGGDKKLEKANFNFNFGL